FFNCTNHLLQISGPPPREGTDWAGALLQVGGGQRLSEDRGSHASVPAIFSLPLRDRGKTSGQRHFQGRELAEAAVPPAASLNGGCRCGARLPCRRPGQVYVSKYM